MENGCEGKEKIINIMKLIKDMKIQLNRIEKKFDKFDNDYTDDMKLLGKYLTEFGNELGEITKIIETFYGDLEKRKKEDMSYVC